MENWLTYFRRIKNKKAEIIILRILKHLDNIFKTISFSILGTIPLLILYSLINLKSHPLENYNEKIPSIILFVITSISYIFKEEIIKYRISIWKIFNKKKSESEKIGAEKIYRYSLYFGMAIGFSLGIYFWFKSFKF